MQTLSLGFSPCPNDTFLFYPLIHGRVPSEGFGFSERLEDVETLNCLALEGALDVTKVSCHAFAHIRDRYVLLRSGGAMGRGCGPLVVAREKIQPNELRGKRIAVPGRLTTALVLLKLFDPTLSEMTCLPFNEIPHAVANGTVDAGVIIHECRFTFSSYGLEMVIDLGTWWEECTGLPLPLGGIAAKRSLGPSTLTALNRIILNSVRYARDNPTESATYVQSHAQEPNSDTCLSHINLYVNDFSLDPGIEGEQALATLLERGERLGLFPPSDLASYVPSS